MKYEGNRGISNNPMVAIGKTNWSVFRTSEHGVGINNPFTFPGRCLISLGYWDCTMKSTAPCPTAVPPLV